LVGPLGALVSLLGGPATLAVVAITGAVAALGKAFNSNFGGIKDTFNIFKRQVERVLPAAKDAFMTFLDAVDLDGIVDSLEKFATLLGEKLQKDVKALKPVFGDLKELLKDNKEEFKIIGGAIGDAIKTFIGFAQTVVKVFGPVFRNVAIPIIRGFITVLDATITRVSNLIKLFNALKGGNISKAIDITGEIAQNEIDTVGELVPTGQQIQQTGQQAQQAISVIIEEDTENVKATARSEAENVVVEKERRAKRNTGGTTSP
jgi:hypothetical protein